MDERLCLRLAATGVLLALALAVVMLRFQRLNELPPGLYPDEGRDASGALRVLQGEHAVFFPDIGHGREPSAIYLLALSTLLFGRTLLTVHFPTALGSAGMVFVIFWMGRLFFGREEESGRATPWRGLLVGGVGAGLMAVSLGQTILGRTAYNKTTHMPLLLCLCLGLLWWGWKERSWWRIGLAGVCAGLLPYTYMVARFVPFLLIFFGLSFLVPLRAVTWGKVRAELPWAAAFVGVAGLVASPLLVHFALHPEHFFLRSQHLWVFDLAHSQGDPLGTFLLNVWEHLLVLGVRGDPSLRNNFAGQPMLNPWEAVFFWLGAGMAVLRWRRSTYRLLVLWFLIMIVPAFLARDSWAPSTMRMLGAAPAIYLLAGVGVWEAYRFLRERYFQKSEIKPAIVMGVVISGLILFQGVGAYRTYFQKWAAEYDLYNIYRVAWADLAGVLNAQPSNTGIAYVIPTFHGQDSFEYLYQGTTPIYFFHPAMPDLAQEIESVLAVMENVSTVKVVEWKDRPAWIGRESGRFAVLFSKYGRYLGSDEYPDFEIHHYTEITLDRPWTFYDYMEPLTVEYDGGIALQGFALGQGTEQLSSEQLLNLEENRSLWMALQWRTAPEMDVNYAISLRLHSSEDEMSYQTDVDLRSLTQLPTSQWMADEAVDTVALLHLPADLQPGEYELRLVVYDAKTLKPTVELGVWEPEATLARLRLAEAQ